MPDTTTTQPVVPTNTVVPAPGTVAGSAQGAAAAAAPNPTTTPDQSTIMSSMVMPMYQNYMSALNQAASQNTQLTTTAGQSADASAQASQAQLAQQTQAGMSTYQNQQTSLTTQNQATQAQLDSAVAGSKVVGDTSMIQYHSNLQTNYNNAMTQLQQAMQQLQMAQTTGDAQINAQDLQTKVQAAQASIQNITSIASSGYNAALGVANYGMQVAQFGMSQQQFQLSQQQTTQQIQQANQQFALANGVSTPFYNLGGVITRTSDGKQYTDQASAEADGWTPDNKNTSVINPGTAQNAQYVMNLATSYPDAGINLTDTPQLAQQKISNSNIYRNAITSSSVGAIGSLTREPIYDSNRNQIGWSTFNNKTGQTDNTDVNGNPVQSFPSGSRAASVSSYTSDPMAGLNSMLYPQGVSFSPGNGSTSTTTTTPPIQGQGAEPLQ